MSYWPGKCLFPSRTKRVHRVRVVWRPPEKLNVSDTVTETEDQSNKEPEGSKTKCNQAKSTSMQSDKKKSNFEKKSGRGRKRRNPKSVSDQSSNSPISDVSEKLVDKSGDTGGKDEDEDELADEKELSEGDIPVVKKKARKKRFGRRSRKSSNRSNIIVKDDDDDDEDDDEDDESHNNNNNSNNNNNNNLNEAGGSEDHLKRMDREWEDAGDSGGQISRCSSSSSLSSSCSHHSLIKHYTNIMMNCCNDQFDANCNVVRNKIDRILKSQWKDRLNNRSKEKSISSSESQSPIPQPVLKHSSSFKLRPARLPLNKKTWSKVKKSNQNSDWLFNNES